jgi:hypothetical protein
LLYGSAAAGDDFVAKRSDYNLLVILTALGMPELKRLAKATTPWIKAGNPPPLCFTPERLVQSADVFPIELLDMQDNHQVLFGTDPLVDIQISKSNLRHQLEYELKSKLIVLREEYLATGGDNKIVQKLLVTSLANFLVLFRAALRLHEPTVPPLKLEAMRSLSKRYGFSAQVFETIHELKCGRSAGTVDSEELFSRYLREIELVVDKVNAQLHSGNA